VTYLVDTGPLVSAFSSREEQFGPWAKEVFRRLTPPFHTCEPVLTEAAHFIGSGEPLLAAMEAGLLICSWRVADHSARVRRLLSQYADREMDLADACLVAMSETYWNCQVITIDVADFRVYRRRGTHAIPSLFPPVQ